MNIRPVGAKLFHAEGWQTGKETGMMKPIVTFRNFVNVPKNVSYKLILTFTHMCHRRATKQWSPNGKCWTTCTVVNGQRVMIHQWHSHGMMFINYISNII